MLTSNIVCVIPFMENLVNKRNNAQSRLQPNAMDYALEGGMKQWLVQ